MTPERGNEAGRAQLPGARKVDAVVVPAVSADDYAFYRTTTQRNLYRSPIPENRGLATYRHFK